MKWLFPILIAVSCLVITPLVAKEEKAKGKAVEAHSQKDGEEAHDHGEEEHNHGEEKHDEEEAHQHDDHKEEAGAHAHGGHGHDESEENPQVGPNKGILQASEKDGIKLSPEAEKNFEISRVKLSSSSMEIPKRAIVTAVAEVNVFRYRNGFYKRIDFKEVSRNGDRVSISSSELKSGDEIVVQGLGFLRIAEIAAFGGAPEGHSH